MCTCIFQGLNTDVAVWQSHRGHGINNNMHIITAGNGIQSGVFDADMGFTSVDHQIGTVHRCEDWVYSRLKHREKLLVCEHLDALVVLGSNYWRDWTKVDLRCCNDWYAKNF